MIFIFRSNTISVTTCVTSLVSFSFFYFHNRHDVIPVVMGAAPEDYERAAPPHSFIHVDDFESPKELAEYLHKLDKDDELYNQYFQYVEAMVKF